MRRFTGSRFLYNIKKWNRRVASAVSVARSSQIKFLITFYQIGWLVCVQTPRNIYGKLPDAAHIKLCTGWMENCSFIVRYVPRCSAQVRRISLNSAQTLKLTRIFLRVAYTAETKYFMFLADTYTGRNKINVTSFLFLHINRGY